jgi:hypothetical protein
MMTVIWSSSELDVYKTLNYVNTLKSYCMSLSDLQVPEIESSQLDASGQSYTIKLSIALLVKHFM